MLFFGITHRHYAEIDIMTLNIKTLALNAKPISVFHLKEKQSLQADGPYNVLTQNSSV